MRTRALAGARVRAGAGEGRHLIAGARAVVCWGVNGSCGMRVRRLKGAPKLLGRESCCPAMLKALRCTKMFEKRPSQLPCSSVALRKVDARTHALLRALRRGCHAGALCKVDARTHSLLRVLRRGCHAGALGLLRTRGVHARKRVCMAAGVRNRTPCATLVIITTTTTPILRAHAHPHARTSNVRLSSSGLEVTEILGSCGPAASAAARRAASASSMSWMDLGKSSHCTVRPVKAHRVRKSN